MTGRWICCLCGEPKGNGHLVGCGVGSSEAWREAHGTPPGPPSSPNHNYDWVTVAADDAERGDG